MSAIDRTGTYKGTIKDFGISLTNKAKLPQLVVTLLAAELYNDVNEVWQDWAEYEQTITGYFVLVSLDAHNQVVKCLNYDQVMEATGWDGETYSGLAAMDLKDKRVQFKVIEDVYDGTTRLKANWIAAENAELGLRKLSKKEVSDLDAKFGITSAKKPATAATPKTAKKTKTPPKPPKIAALAESCTEEDAYQACIETNQKLAKPVPSDVLDDYWTHQVTAIAADTDNVTDEEWAKIRDAVLNDINIPF